MADELPRERTVGLSAEEVEVLLRALTRYRGTLPTYLQSNQRELRVIEELVARLSSED
jgi:hypothetical protein